MAMGYDGDIREVEKVAKPLILALPEKTKTTPFEIAAKMEGGKNRVNISAAETMMRRMHGTIRESDGRAWIWKVDHGQWLMKKLAEPRMDFRDPSTWGKSK